MDPKKIVVLGAVPGPIRGLIDSLERNGDVIDFKTEGDFLGDTMVIPRGYPTTIFTEKRSKTGAARVKRNAKQRRRRKGK